MTGKTQGVSRISIQSLPVQTKVLLSLSLHAR